ncbi:MAG: 30S ribosomal protein S17e [Candidatus Thermoplasmatota archaeon]|nr:30S ribosomal protein S17e [Candidatus Thermoplasmatota archaeon]
MGANKPAYIKRAAAKVLEAHGDKFTEDYSQNKRIIDELYTVESKEVKHRLVGYITSKTRAEKRNALSSELEI